MHQPLTVGRCAMRRLLRLDGKPRRTAEPNAKGGGGREGVTCEPIDWNRRSVVPIQMHKTGLNRLSGRTEPGTRSGRMGARVVTGMVVEMTDAGDGHEPASENETGQQGPHQPRRPIDDSVHLRSLDIDVPTGSCPWMRATIS